MNENIHFSPQECDLLLALRKALMTTGELSEHLGKHKTNTSKRCHRLKAQGYTQKSILFPTVWELTELGYDATDFINAYRKFHDLATRANQDGN